MFEVISFGHICFSSSFIKILNLKTQSYLFNWLVSKLDVIKDCIETKFIHFLNRDNYKQITTQTVNIIDKEKIFICNETAQINYHYETDKDNINKYSFKLVLNHHDIINNNDDYEYYKRCIERLYKLFEKDYIKKYFIYFNPIMSINDFENKKEDILCDFDNSCKFIIQKTKNIFGIYFILLKRNKNTDSIKFKETKDYVVFLIYCNNNFIDGGSPFMGNYESEEQEVMCILKSVFNI